MVEDAKKGPRPDGVDDYYVRGEETQGVLFYLALALLLAFAIVAAAMAYGQLSRGLEALWPATYFVASMTIGAVVGVFAYGAFSRFLFLQMMLRNSLKASSVSFPEVYDAVGLAAGRLSMPAPAVFIAQSPAVNAYLVRLGLRRGKKVIMLNTGLLRAMDKDELLFIIGHELSHAKYGQWRRMPGIGLPYVVAPQYNEHRCDRGGLVVSGDVDASVRALLKLATGREFIDRVDVKSLGREKTEAPSRILQILATHPMIDARIKELLRFHGSLEYKKIG